MKSGDYDASFITEALPAFISEAREQIEALEQLLLQLEDAPDDRELLDALFRCAHTVKGSAGLFGLDRVVAFTHHVESLLDRLREGQLVLTPELSTLLLRANDQIRLLVDSALDPKAEEGGAAQAREAVVQELMQAGGALEAVTVASGPAPTDLDSRAQRWHVSVQFGADTFRNGMDPLAILNYLRGLGGIPRLVNAVCDKALLASFVRRSDRVNYAMVGRAIRELEGNFN